MFEEYSEKKEDNERKVIVGEIKNMREEIGVEID